MSRRIRITIDDGNEWVIDKDFPASIEHIEMLIGLGEVGDKVHLEIVEMSDEEFSELPEFTGW